MSAPRKAPGSCCEPWKRFCAPLATFTPFGQWSPPQRIVLNRAAIASFVPTGSIPLRHDMISTPQRQEQEDDFSNNVRIFTEELRDPRIWGRWSFASRELQEELRNGLLCGLTIRSREPVILR